MHHQYAKRVIYRIEVPDTLSAAEIDKITRNITAAVYLKHGVVLTAVSVYSRNTKNDRAGAIRDDVYAIANSHEYVLQTHGFYLNEEEKYLRFDIIISFDAPDRRQLYLQIVKEVNEKYPEYKPLIALDTDFSES